MEPAHHTTTHCGGRLLVMTGNTTYRNLYRVTDPIREGLRIIMMLSGEMSLKAGNAPRLEFQSPISFAVFSKAEAERDQCFRKDVPLRVILLQIAPDLIESELGIDSARVLGTDCASEDGNGLIVKIRQPDPAMRAVGTQLLACPTHARYGLYRCAKAMELASLFLDGCDDTDRTGRPGHLSSTETERVRMARDILVSEVEDAPDLVTLARRCGTNVWTLNRDFRVLYGTSPHAYLQEYRLQSAYRMLASGQMTVGQVAGATGYSQSHFATLFRRRFDISPSALLPRTPGDRDGA